MKRFEVLSLFPALFDSFLSEGLIKKAVDQQKLCVEVYNFRQHGLGKHQHVDDTPYGGGAGMLLRVEPIVEAIEACDFKYKAQGLKTHKILVTPQGQPFKQAKAASLSQSTDVLMLICGRYEGFDERIRDFVDEEISIGDFICLGGELAAMLMIESIARLVPGVMGNQESSHEESYSNTLLEYPQYTRPASFRGANVPEVLLSGNHQNIRKWREQEAIKRTQKRRPDLFKQPDTL